MSDETTTTTFPCPDPQAPFCGLPCEEINNCPPEPVEETTTTVVEVPSEPAAPVGVDELAYTGAFELMVALVAIALILVGAVLVSVSKGPRRSGYTVTGSVANDPAADKFRQVSDRIGRRP